MMMSYADAKNYNEETTTAKKQKGDCKSASIRPAKKKKNSVGNVCVKPAKKRRNRCKNDYLTPAEKEQIDTENVCVKPAKKRNASITPAKKRRTDTENVSVKPAKKRRNHCTNYSIRSAKKRRIDAENGLTKPAKENRYNCQNDSITSAVKERIDTENVSEKPAMETNTIGLDFSKFVILRSEASNRMSPLEVLVASARFCKTKFVCRQESCQAGKFFCVIELAGKRIASAVSNSSKMATNDVAHQVLEKLKKHCFTIIIKDPRRMAGKTAKQVGRQCGISQSSCSTLDHKQAAKSDTLRNICLHLPGFQYEDLVVFVDLPKQVKNICRGTKKAGYLVSNCRDKRNKCFFVVSRHHCVKELIASMRVSGNDTQNYLLVKPTGEKRCVKLETLSSTCESKDNADDKNVSQEKTVHGYFNGVEDVNSSSSSSCSLDPNGLLTGLDDHPLCLLKCEVLTTLDDHSSFLPVESEVLTTHDDHSPFLLVESEVLTIHDDYSPFLPVESEVLTIHVDHSPLMPVESEVLTIHDDHSPFLPVESNNLLPFAPLKQELLSNADYWIKKDQILLQRSVKVYSGSKPVGLDSSSDSLGFVIVTMQSVSSYELSPLVMLDISAELCGLAVKYEESAVFNKFRCCVTLAGVVVGLAVGDDEFCAKMNAAYESLRYLSTFYPTIVVKDLSKQRLDCSGQDVITPHQLLGKVVRGTSSSKNVNQSLSNLFNEIFSAYLKVPVQRDLIFSHALTAEERVLLNSVAHERKLGVFRCDSDDVIIARFRDPFEVVEHVRANCGESLRYIVIEPTAHS